ncbi:MAG: mechanosensitive ion channel protein [Helicobacteraceae bacterium CG2_30_36_10]|nr:MAG: mechanosensitive ion channel protein [Helicobacteraceae bacterium CG2_30_36_10]
MQNLLEAQELGYNRVLEQIMSNKQNYLQEKDLYAQEILALKKIIRINERAGNTYAVLRDEVKLKFYQILRNQNSMIRKTLLALDTSDISTFELNLNSIIAENQLENQRLMERDYEPFLVIEEDSKTLREAQENIRELYALIDLNIDVINHLYSFEKRMYRLNKYSKYHLISTVVSINSTAFASTVNPFLENYGLSVVKILFILVLSLIVYFIRTVLYVYFERYFLRATFLKKYADTIMKKIKKPLAIVIILINIEFALYIYNDFISVDLICKSFNVMYSFLFFWLMYRVLNVVADVKMEEIANSNKQIKHEMINLGKKILNFIIIIIGLLFILHFSGADLTAALSGLGIGGLAVALAAKDSLSNFFGTVSILLSDVYSQGDWIVVDGQEGVVIEIGLRVTTLRTFDNALIAIPNATLANKDVKNWNKRMLGRRIKMSLGITYSSKSEDIKNAINEIREMLDKHPQIATKNTSHEYIFDSRVKLVSKDDYQGVKKNLLVYLDEFSDSSINILVYCFTKSVVWDEWLTTKEDIMYKIMAILEKNSLEFAFPSVSIYKEN